MWQSAPNAALTRGDDGVCACWGGAVSGDAFWDGVAVPGGADSGNGDDDDETTMRRRAL